MKKLLLIPVLSFSVMACSSANVSKSYSKGRTIASENGFAMLADKNGVLPEQNFTVKCKIGVSLHSLNYSADPVSVLFKEEIEGELTISKEDFKGKNIKHFYLGNSEFVSTLKLTKGTSDFSSKKVTNFDGKERTIQELLRGNELRLAVSKCGENGFQFIGYLRSMFNLGSEYSSSTFDMHDKDACNETPEHMKLRNKLLFLKTFNNVKNEEKDEQYYSRVDCDLTVII